VRATAIASHSNVRVEVRSWIENVIVPALVDKFIAEKALRKAAKDE
jgi:hypothetical protein